ncbi:MAG: MBL fold metallo-hydrolase [Thermoplasmatales archaeon]|nr:MAG: MBL fold metallo-hydrolase [Thermoplasmatales archaeon]
MIIRFLGTHNAESKYTSLVSFLIDDVLAVESGGITSELSFSEQEEIKAILLSHGHYDHIKGVPAFAFNNACHTTRVFATQQTLKILSSHLIDGVIYPKFTEKTPVCGEQSLELVTLEPFIPVDIEGYRVLALPVNHNNISAVGFEITSKDGKKLFYTGDTGPGLSAIWEHVSPQLIIMDVTFPNRLEDTAKNSAHLCPKMLKKELIEFQRIKGYFPRIVLVHFTPKFKEEIREEVKEVAKELKLSIELASEGNELIV